jgi:5-methylcytosine-specific restriction endonuclease McrA
VKRTPLKRKSWLRRGRCLARKVRLRAFGSRAASECDQRRAWREAVLARAGHRCERCGDPASDAHHIWRKSAGGPFELWNGTALCRKDHSAVHDHSIPGWRQWFATDEATARRIRTYIDDL